MSNAEFAHYTTEYISGVMSLRTPQKVSLEILDAICEQVALSGDTDMRSALETIHKLYPTCSNFEREFISLTFALATGVGKTRLMGAFIAYLYTRREMKNFFVVAPNTTIYQKLRSDLGDPNSEKYVFKGLSCFAEPPLIVTEEDYRNKKFYTTSEVTIYIYNIDKFNKDNAKMRAENENLGEAFISYLAGKNDLVLIMDESHHYRAERGAQALNDLKPVLGLELTATPLVTKGSKQIPFKNVVYEYPLSRAIADGYTRTPYAITRSNVQFYNFGDEQQDKLMLTDGLWNHERVKRRLIAYAANHNKRVVKPFMLVVCKDTEHAEWVRSYICSDEFGDGRYRDKTIVVHSKMKGSETEANLQLLLDVEKADNPIEIVIHVNMLKEGWDVNNLYTIVPLRTAASKILREQMVGRGLRLPYGERTGDKEVDAVSLTAHDKFSEILEEAQKGDSIFNAGNVIYAETIEPEQISLAKVFVDFEPDEQVRNAYHETGIAVDEDVTAVFKAAHDLMTAEVMKQIHTSPTHTVDHEKAAQKVIQRLTEDLDLGKTYEANELPLGAWIKDKAFAIEQKVTERFIPIPRIRITDDGVEEYRFVDFELDLAPFTHTPIENDIIRQNLENMAERIVDQGARIDFEAVNPPREILQILRAKPEIDYQKCSALLFKLISGVCNHYAAKYDDNGLKNIVMMNKRDIAGKIYAQMMTHFYCSNGLIQEEVISVRNHNIAPTYTWSERRNLFQNPDGDIHKVLFDGIRYGVFESAKFDSLPELLFARVLEQDAAAGSVKKWLRPSSTEFGITYNHGRSYEPDFVVETEEMIYLVEVKGEDKLTDPDVLAKKERAILYCEAVTRWEKANGGKEWRYLFIPSKQIQPNSSFKQLAQQFRVAD